MPIVRVLRPFANTHPEDIVHPGDVIIVSADRARDLGDLVGPVPDAQSASAPDNKARPAPTTKPGRKPADRATKAR